MTYLRSNLVCAKVFPGVILLSLLHALVAPGRLPAEPRHARGHGQGASAPATQTGPAHVRLAGSMTPTSGVPTGGTGVLIQGHGFNTAKGATIVQFHFKGNLARARSISCPDTTTCFITAPQSFPAGHVPLSVPVTITVNGATAPLGTFQYSPIQPDLPTKGFCMACEQYHGQCTRKNGQLYCDHPW